MDTPSPPPLGGPYQLQNSHLKLDYECDSDEEPLYIDINPMSQKAQSIREEESEGEEAETSHPTENPQPQDEIETLGSLKLDILKEAMKTIQNDEEGVEETSTDSGLEDHNKANQAKEKITMEETEQVGLERSQESAERQVISPEAEEKKQGKPDTESQKVKDPRLYHADGSPKYRQEETGEEQGQKKRRLETVSSKYNFNVLSLPVPEWGKQCHHCFMVGHLRKD